MIDASADFVVVGGETTGKPCGCTCSQRVKEKPECTKEGGAE